MNRARLAQRTASARQVLLEELPQSHEVGAALCHAPDGSLIQGPMAEGHAYGVNIPLNCPPGTEVIGTWHTHPDAGTVGSGELKPSEQDLRMTRQHGHAALCITTPADGRTQCWPAPK